MDLPNIHIMIIQGRPIIPAVVLAPGVKLAINPINHTKSTTRTRTIDPAPTPSNPPTTMAQTINIRAIVVIGILPNVGVSKKNIASGKEMRNNILSKIEIIKTLSY